MADLAFVNGAFYPLAEARISVEDRGFQFADGVYEVILFRGAAPVALDAHLQRLQNSCREILLDVDIEALGIRGILADGVNRAGLPQTLAYIQITRGAAPRNHLFPAGTPPTVVLTFRAPVPVPPDRRASGIRVMTTADDRWSRCHIKSIALLSNVLARNAAFAAGFDDVLLMAPDGTVREASAANVFVIRGQTLHTPPLSSAILPGVTRGRVLDCARRLELGRCEAPIALPDLLRADEVFLSSTTIDALAVVGVDDRIIGPGRPGPITQRVFQALQQ